MESSGSFIYPLDLGDLGEYDAVVLWRGYRPAQEDEDDYPTMEIQSVTVDVDQLFDLSLKLSQSCMKSIREEAWGHFPSREEGRAEFRANMAELEAA